MTTPDEPLDAPLLFSSNPGTEAVDPATDPATEQLINRIARVFKHRKKWAKRSDVSCFRVYSKDIPDHPFICDWYDGDAVVWTLTRTRNETEEQQQAWISQVRLAVGRGLSLPGERIHLKERRPQKGRQKEDKDHDDGQYHRLAGHGTERIVSEQGLRFAVNLEDYLDTGLFLDHRTTRAFIRGVAQDKTVLNLFAYTGSFTCYAAAGGARQTLTVDLSKTYLAWAERNLALNNLTDPRHEFLKGDCMKYLGGKPNVRFDLIICDPPTFSNSNAMTRTWSVERDQAWLFERLYAWLAPGGSAWFSTNCHGFKLTSELPPFASVTEITQRTTPEDFADRIPHRCWILTR